MNQRLELRFLMFALVAVGLVVPSAAAGSSPAVSAARTKYNFNIGWQFHLNDPSGDPTSADYDDGKWETVSVPHNLENFALFLSPNPHDVYQKEFLRKIGWYRKHFTVPHEKGAKVFLEFEAVGQVTDVWVNGKHVGQHSISGLIVTAKRLATMSLTDSYMTVTAGVVVEDYRREDFTTWEGTPF